MGNVFGVPVGWAGGTSLTSVPEVRAEAQYAAESGFDSYWVSQIVGVDPIVALAAVADDLGSLAEVGTSVVPLYGRHPLALAQQALTAQSAVGGRFTLGIGPSHATVAEGFFHEPYTRPYTRTVDFIEAMAPLLQGESVHFMGEEVSTSGWLTIDAQPVPMLLAAMGTRMLKLAGGRTAGTSLGGAVGPKTVASHIAPIINAAAEAAGNRPPRIKALVTIAVTDDPDAEHRDSVERSEGYAQLPAYRAMLDREGLASPGDLLCRGSKDQVVEQVMRWVDAGATELRIGVSGSNPDVRAASRAALVEMMRG